MGWNYRVWRSVAVENGEEVPHYAIYETHYDGDSIRCRTEHECAPSGETVEELVSDIAWFTAAITKPVLDMATGREIEPAARLADDLVKCVNDNPHAFPAMLQRAKGSA